MLAGRGKFILKIQPALLKLEFLDDSPDLSIQGFPAHISFPPLRFIQESLALRFHFKIILGFTSEHFFSLHKNFHVSCYKAFSPYMTAANTWAPIALSKLKKFQLSIADIVIAP